MNSIKYKLSTGLANILFIGLCVIWFLNYSSGLEGPFASYFEIYYPVFIVILSIICFMNSSIKGEGARGLSNAPLFMSLGLFAWGIGELAWYYYVNIANIEVPYPSYADVAYITFYPLAIASVLSHIRNIRGHELWNLKFARGLWGFIVVLVCTSYLFVVMFSFNQLNDALIKTFFDTSYIVWDALLLIFLFVMLGQVFTTPGLNKVFYTGTLVVVLGMLFMFTADMLFAYMTELDTYVDGNLSDLMFFVSAYLLALGTNKLSAAYRTVKPNSQSL